MLNVQYRLNILWIQGLKMIKISIIYASIHIVLYFLNPSLLHWLVPLEVKRRSMASWWHTRWREENCWGKFGCNIFWDLWLMVYLSLLTEDTNLRWNFYFPNNILSSWTLADAHIPAVWPHCRQHQRRSPGLRTAADCHSVEEASPDLRNNLTEVWELRSWRPWVHWVLMGGEMSGSYSLYFWSCDSWR